MTRIASRLAVRVEDGDTTDNKGLRQRFKYTGRREGLHQVGTQSSHLLLSQLRKRHLCSNELANNLRNPFEMKKGSSQHGRTVSYEDVFGANADGLQRTLDLE